VPRYVLDATSGLYPSVGLEIHEWRAHGACTGLSPTAYFDAVKRARDLVHVPADFQAVQQGRPTTAIDVARAFIDANPGLRPGMAAVTCRRDQLEETRICLTKDLRGFRACPEVARDQCSAASIRIPAPQ
jgi:ribonuclease T2